MRRENVPDIIIDRAVELWCRALARPRFDNGDSSTNGGFAMALHIINAGRDRDQVNYGEAIERFRRILSAQLKEARDKNGQPTGRQGPNGPEFYRLERHLGTDHPDPALAKAATEAGVPHSAFSWKSTVSFYDDGCVSASFGYGAPHFNHYPLSDGSWLVCQLRGEDMPKIIAAVESGVLDLPVERVGAEGAS